MYKNVFYKTKFKDRSCEYCGLYLVRSQYGDRLESADHYNKRHFCNRQCMYKAQKGAGNPNYKGIMPRCADCGRAVTYPSKSSKQAERCKNCFEIWAKKTNYYSQTAQAIKIAENMRKSKGICPTALKPYLFKKGNVPHNFVGGTCSVKNCTRPFVAKGFCSMHWQHNRKRSNV